MSKDTITMIPDAGPPEGGGISIHRDLFKIRSWTGIETRPEEASECVSDRIGKPGRFSGFSAVGVFGAGLRWVKARATSFVLILLFLGGSSAVRGQADKLYWTDRGAGKVQRANLDGSDVDTLYDLPGTNLRGIAVDRAAGFFFFADNARDRIYRSTLDGRSLKVIVEKDLGFPADVAVDPHNKSVYWCDQQMGRIGKCDYDGGNRKTVIETPQPYYLDIDSKNDRIFWGDFSQGNIFQCKLDGGEKKTLIKGLTWVRSVKLDAGKDTLYWIDRETHKVQRCLLSTLKIEDLYTGLDTPHGMCLDLKNRKLFWTDTGTNRVPGSTGARAVNTGSLDGSMPVKTVVKASQPWDVEVVPGKVESPNPPD